MVIVRLAQSIQNKKFLISLEYLKKEGRGEVDFLHADKQIILQVDTINLGGHSQASANYQNYKFAKSLLYLKKEMGDEAEFC